MDIRRLTNSDITLICQIDRSEIVNSAYRVEDGELVEFPVSWDIPSWNREGADEHSLNQQIKHWTPVVNDGGILLGAFDGVQVLGLAIVVPEYEVGLTWLAFLHVSRPHRGRGAGAALWAASERIALDNRSSQIYVSAVPSGPTIDFYRRRGCELATSPHPELFAQEPEDIHLIRNLYVV